MSTVRYHVPRWAREATDRRCLACGVRQANPERGWVSFMGRRGWLCDDCLEHGAGVTIVGEELVAMVLRRTPVLYGEDVISPVLGTGR